MFKKLLLAVVFSFILLTSCSSNEEEKIAIRDHIKSCTKDLIESHFRDGLRKKEYEFNAQKFCLYIDSLGRPVLYEDNNYIGSITL